MNNVRVSLSTKREHIVLTEDQFDELGLATGSTKRAILSIQADKSPEQVLEHAKSIEWSLQGPVDASGFYTPMRVVGTPVTAESDTIEQEA